MNYSGQNWDLILPHWHRPMRRAVNRNATQRYCVHTQCNYSFYISLLLLKWLTLFHWTITSTTLNTCNCLCLCRKWKYDVNLNTAALYRVDGRLDSVTVTEATTAAAGMVKDSGIHAGPSSTASGPLGSPAWKSEDDSSSQYPPSSSSTKGKPHHISRPSAKHGSGSYAGIVTRPTSSDRLCSMEEAMISAEGNPNLSLLVLYVHSQYPPTTTATINITGSSSRMTRLFHCLPCCHSLFFCATVNILRLWSFWCWHAFCLVLCFLFPW